MATPLLHDAGLTPPSPDAPPLCIHYPLPILLAEGLALGLGDITHGCAFALP